MSAREVVSSTLALLLLTSLGGATTKPPVEVDVFEAESCPHCVAVKEEVFDKASRQFPFLKFNYFELAEPRNFQLLLKVQEEFFRSRGEVPPEGKFPPLKELPIVFAGNHTLKGEEAARKGFVPLIESLRGTVVPALSARVEAGPLSVVRSKRICIAYFFTPGCPNCDTMEFLLRYLQSTTSDLVVRKFDLTDRSNKELLEAFGIMVGLPEKRRLVPPSLFVGERPFVGVVNETEVIAAVGSLREVGTGVAWEQAEGYRELARRSLLRRFETMPVSIVLAAGLADGINPCAFATIVFLVVYLTSLGRTRRLILWCGLLFAAGVWVAYFGMGVGFQAMLAQLSQFGALRKCLFWIGIVLCLTLGAVSFAEFLVGLRRGTSAIVLRLPERLKARIQMLVASRARTKGIVIGSFVTGALVATLEVVCTGQVYLPTILYFTGVSGAKTRAYGYLFLYNAAFILPLIVVFVVVYAGVSSERLAEVTRRHIAKAKLALALVFGLLAFALYLAL